MNRKWGVLGILLAVCLLALAVGGFALLPGAGPGASSAPHARRVKTWPAWGA